MSLEIVAFDSLTEDDLTRLFASPVRSRYLLERPYEARPREAWAVRALRKAAAQPGARAAGVRADGGACTGAAVVRQSDWDTEHWGFRMGRIEQFVLTDVGSARLLAEWTESFATESGLRFSSARISGVDLDAVHALEAVGYRYQETTIVPWLDMSRWLAGHADPEVRPASEGDLERLCAIARATFRTDRFHNDPRFDSERADAVYEKWVRSWFAEQSESRFTRVLEHEGEVAGFVMYEVVDELELVNGPVCILVLGGADPALGVPGLGTRLWSALLDDAKERARYTSATMIASNSGVFNLYVKLGFRFTSTEVTLHRWYE